MPSFTLARAGAEDMLEMADITFRTFLDSNSRNLYMGPDTSESRQRLANKWIAEIKTHHEVNWVKVIDDTKGNIVGASMWRVYPNYIPDFTTLEDRSLPWLQDQPEQLQRMNDIFELHCTTRQRLWTTPFIQLEVCFVDPAYGRQGVGAMMVKWGCDLADAMFLPICVEASIAGGKLYEKFGFKHLEKKGLDLSGDIKRREPARTVIKDVRLPKEAAKVEEPALTATPAATMPA